MSSTCQVCGYPGLESPPRSASGGPSDEICPSCRFQPGYTDDALELTGLDWRRRWVHRGCPWSVSDEEPPEGWDGAPQLQRLLEEPGRAESDEGR